MVGEQELKEELLKIASVFLISFIPRIAQNDGIHHSHVKPIINTIRFFENKNLSTNSTLSMVQDQFLTLILCIDKAWNNKRCGMNLQELSDFSDAINIYHLSLSVKGEAKEVGHESVATAEKGD